MEVLIILLFAALIGVAALLASIAIWAPRATFVRSAAVVATAMFIPLTYLGMNELLSKPKPMAQEWADKNVAEATVLGVSLDEGKAIYLWLRLDGALAPRYYELPWQANVAERLQKLVEEAIEKGATIRITNPFTRQSLQDLGQLNMEIVPPPPLPRKRLPDVPQIFNPRERSI
jgi:hypothetical protein